MLLSLELPEGKLFVGLSDPPDIQVVGFHQVTPESCAVAGVAADHRRQNTRPTEHRRSRVFRRLVAEGCECVAAIEVASMLIAPENKQTKCCAKTCESSQKRPAASRSLFGWWRFNGDVQFVQLFGLHFPRSFGHQIHGSLRLGKCDAIADVIQTTKQHDYAVDS